ncbi:MAG: hypothetical protein ACLUJG_08080 [Lawsonibacter sp.]
MTPSSISWVWPKRPDRLEIGEEPVGAAARARQARVLLLAADAAPNTVPAGRPLRQRPGAPCGSKCPSPRRSWAEQLGRSSCAMLAVTDFGFAAALAEKLAARGRGAVRPRSSAAEG